MGRQAALDGVDVILLDNMSLAELRQAVALHQAHPVLQAMAVDVDAGHGQGVGREVAAGDAHLGEGHGGQHGQRAVAGAQVQHLAGGVGHRAVHHPVVVVHHPQVPDLLGQLARLGRTVVVGDPHQHAQPLADATLAKFTATGASNCTKPSG